VRAPAVPYLARTHLAGDLQTVDGCPVLDGSFQSSVPGLFFTGFIAARDFGPFFGFVRGCPATLPAAAKATGPAKLVPGRAIRSDPAVYSIVRTAWGPGASGSIAEVAEGVAYAHPRITATTKPPRRCAPRDQPRRRANLLTLAWSP
jgi:hypothetical protein